MIDYYSLITNAALSNAVAGGGGLQVSDKYSGLKTHSDI